MGDQVGVRRGNLPLLVDSMRRIWSGVAALTGLTRSWLVVYAARNLHAWPLCDRAQKNSVAGERVTSNERTEKWRR